MILVNEPDLTGNEIKYLTECIETNWISSEGPFVKKFEKLFAQKVSRKHGMTVSNGSVALDIALEAVGVEKGDEVILPTFTIISPAASVIKLGATPVLVDSNLEDWNICVDQIEQKISPKTKAIIVVHIYGLPVDMDPILALAKKYNLKVIEDAAEMHGQTYKGKACGSFGDISTFSFYPNKHITTGEGGMIVCDDDTVADKVKSIRNLCFQKERRFVHEHIGTNARFSNLQAAVGLAQLERLDKFVERKRKMGAYYTEELSNLTDIKLPLTSTTFADNIYWVFGLLLNKNHPLDTVQIGKKLGEMGIQTRPFFYPMHSQPVFIKMGLFQGENYPNADYLADKGFYIPSGLKLTENQMDTVVSALKSILK